MSRESLQNNTKVVGIYINHAGYLKIMGIYNSVDIYINPNGYLHKFRGGFTKAVGI